MSNGVGVFYSSMLNTANADLSDIQAGSLTISDELTITGAILNLDQYDNTSVTFANNQFSVKDNGITTAKVADGAITDAKITSVGGNKISSNIPTSIYFMDSTDNTKLFKFDCANLNTARSITLKAAVTSFSQILTMPAIAIDTLVGNASTSTLTNKTLTSPKITSGGGFYSTSNLNWYFALPTVAGSGNDTLCAINTTQTLTNKTISASSNTITNLTNSSISAGANIDCSKLADGTVSNTEFQYINNLNQSVSTTDNVQFGSLKTGTIIPPVNGGNITVLDSGVLGRTFLTDIDTQTITSKTISGSHNTITNINSGSISGYINATQIVDGSISNAEFLNLNGLDQTLATTDIVEFSRVITPSFVPPAGGIIYLPDTGVADRTVITDKDTQTIINKKLNSASSYIMDNADNTKLALFDVSGITTATTRTYIMPNANTTIATTDTTQTLTNKTMSGASNTFTSIPNSATTATSANTASAIVARDASGDFTASDITCDSVSIITFNSWTATMNDGSGNNFTISSQYCYYKKTKFTSSLFFYECVGLIAWSARTSSANATRISLPALVSNANTGTRAVGCVGWTYNIAWTNGIAINANNNTSYININDLSKTTSSQATNIKNSGFGSTGEIQFSINFIGTT
jgi:hypothetical protein